VVGVRVCLEEAWGSADREQHSGSGKIGGWVTGAEIAEVDDAREPSTCRHDVRGLQVCVKPQLFGSASAGPGVRAL
jgi:hypothetical protein